MSKFADNIKKEDIERERRNNTNRTIGKYFLNLSTVIFTAMIVGTIASKDFEQDDIWMVVFGMISSIITLIIGYKLTNRK